MNRSKLKRWLPWMLLPVLAGCAATPPRPTERPPTVAGEVRLDHVAGLRAHPQFTNACVAAPDFVKDCFRTITQLEFLVELQPLR